MLNPFLSVCNVLSMSAFVTLFIVLYVSVLYSSLFLLSAFLSQHNLSYINSLCLYAFRVFQFHAIVPCHSKLLLVYHLLVNLLRKIISATGPPFATVEDAPVFIASSKCTRSVIFGEWWQHPLPQKRRDR